MPCAPPSTCPVAHPTLRLSCCQVEVHPYFRNDALLGWCRGQGIHVTAYAPLGSPDSESIFPRKRPLVLMQDEAVRAVAERTGKNVGQARTRSSSWVVVGRISRQGPCSCGHAFRGACGSGAADLLLWPRPLPPLLAQVLIRWGLQHGTSVIPKSTSADRIKGNLQVRRKATQAGAAGTALARASGRQAALVSQAGKGGRAA
jgi:diketogulonate reductase-like aldo/keto reductase